MLDGTLPDLGTSSVVWRMTPHRVTAAEVGHFAAVLGVSGSPVSSATGWEVPGADAQLHVFTGNGDVSVSYAYGAPGVSGGSGGSGGSTGSAPPDSATPNPAPPETVTPQTVTPQTATRDNVPPVPAPAPGAKPATVPTPTGPATTVAPPVGVPDAAGAEQAARALLDRLGVLAGQQWSTAVTDSGGVAVACAVGTPCPTVPPQVYARTVTFEPLLDDRVVRSAGWSVTIGERGRIESLDGEWATPVSIGSLPLQPTAAAFADLQHGTGRFPGPQPLAADSGAGGDAVVVHVTGVALGVARWDAYDGSANVVDVVPTYRFHARGDGGSTYDIEVLALAPNAVTFTNPHPTPEPPQAKPEPAQPASPSAP